MIWLIIVVKYRKSFKIFYLLISDGGISSDKERRDLSRLMMHHVLMGVKFRFIVSHDSRLTPHDFHHPR